VGLEATGFIATAFSARRGSKATGNSRKIREGREHSARAIRENLALRSQARERIFLARCSKILMPGSVSFFPSFLPSFREDRLHDYFSLRLSFVRRLILLFVRFSSGISFPSNDSSQSKKADERPCRFKSFCGEKPERRSGMFKYNWISNFIPFNRTYIYI